MSACLRIPVSASLLLSCDLAKVLPWTVDVGLSEVAYCSVMEVVICSEEDINAPGLLNFRLFPVELVQKSTDLLMYVRFY